MASFTLRNVDRDPRWARGLAKARAAGWSMPRLLMQLLDDYAAGRIEPSTAPPAEFDSQPVARCPRCLERGEAVMLGPAGDSCPRCGLRVPVVRDIGAS